MLQSLFHTISQLITVYSFLCLIRILLSWIPQAQYSAFGQILSSLCDPYLNWFRRFRFTRIGMVDFSPILAMGILSIVSDIFSNLIMTGSFSLWYAVLSLVRVIWSFVSFICNLLIIFLLVRLVYDFSSVSSTSPFWYSLDRFLNPVIAKVSSFVPNTRTFSYRARLILTIVVIVGIRILLGLLIGSLFVGFYAAKII